MNLAVKNAAEEINQIPYLTASLPGIGGTIRCCPEDFEVEEIPAYSPVGSGDHRFLWVEKRGRNTRDVAREIARFAGANERDIGVAGQKDKHALTRQFFSLPASKEAPTEGNGWRVLSSGLHVNKLKIGHLHGNHFKIRIRQTCNNALDKATSIAEALQRHGLPNAFGPQRFGHGGSNARLGRELLLGVSTAETKRAKRDRFLRRMAICAFQSLLFNRILGNRMRDGLFGTALSGDIMKKHQTGGLFVCEDSESDQDRLNQLEISPTGALFGHRMMTAMHETFKREEFVLEEEKLTLASFAAYKGEAEGSRRPLRVPINIKIEQENDCLVVCFALNKGSFATAVLRELMKTDTDYSACELPEEN